jgi:hypothetical protein
VTDRMTSEGLCAESEFGTLGEGRLEYPAMDDCDDPAIERVRYDEAWLLWREEVRARAVGDVEVEWVRFLFWRTLGRGRTGEDVGEGSS